MHSRQLHDATSAYLPPKRHVTAASVADHHQAVVSTLTPAQAVARGIYPYVPTSPHSAAAAAEAVAVANHRAAMAAAAYHHSISGGGAPGGPPGTGGGPQGASQPPPGSQAAAQQAAAAAALSAQLSHLGHPGLNSLFISPQHPPPQGAHNGAIVPSIAAANYRNLSDQYAQELLTAHSLERLKQTEIANAIAAASGDPNSAAQFNSFRFAAANYPAALASLGLANNNVVAALARQEQALANAQAASAAMTSSSSNSISTSAPTSLSSASNSASAASSSSRRRPSLLPHTAPTNEAFNLALNSSNTSNAGSNSTNGANAQSSRGNSFFNERDKYEFSRYSPYENANRKSTLSSQSSPSPMDRLPSSSSAASSSQYAHLVSQSMSAPVSVVNSHHPHSLPPGGPMLIPPLGVSVGPSSSVQHPGSYHPSVVITSSASSHHHPSVVQVHHALPTPPPQPPISHHQSSGSHHSSSTLASLQHNHLSPGHLLNEIHEAKRPRLMSLSNNASGSFAAALAAASGTNLMSGSGLPHHGTASHFSDQSARGPHLNQELHVDTRENTDSKKEQVEYMPQFEAISPTPADESCLPLQSEKDEILGNISVIDREIAKVQNNLQTLNNRAQLVEEVISKPSGEEDNQKSEPKEPTIEKKIYSQNLIKAKKCHEQFSRLGPLNELPLYNQAIDLAIVRHNHVRYQSFRKRLIERIRTEEAERNAHIKCLCEKYDTSIREWLKKLEKKDTAPAKKAKDTKTREYFEKQFTELKKAREDRERLQRSGQRIRSEADMDEIIDGLQLQAMEDKKMRSYAVIPPLMHDHVLKPSPHFDNRNGFIADPMELHDDVKCINIWTEGEKIIFREKYLQHPKNFGVIASFLERKSVADCVRYYYISKKTENYKQLLKKHAKKRTRALAKQQQQANSAANRGSPMIKEMERGLKPYPQSATSVILPYATPLTSSSSTITYTISVAVAASVTDTKVKASTSTVTSILNKTSSTLTTTSAGGNSSVATTTTTTSSTKATSDTARDSALKCGADSDNDDGDGEATSEQDVSCCKCGCDKPESLVKSRTVSAANIALYGIAHHRAGLRVCLKCHLKHVRRQCPIASCNTPRRKLKRLKSLPTQWVDMPAEARARFATELDIPVDAKIGCARCVMRISRRIGIVTNSTSANSVANIGNDLMANSSKATTKADIRRSWTDGEIDQLRALLRQHGKNWQQIAAGFGGIKSANDCKKLFFSNKRECNLASALHEYNESVGKSNAKPDTDSDDELSDESGEETSSMEDVDHNSDTASASSQVEPMLTIDGTSSLKTPTGTMASSQQQPPNNSLQDLKGLSASQGSLKSDYDSSATLSADEGNPPESSASAHPSAISSLNSTASSTATSSVTSSLFSRAGVSSATSSLFGPPRHSSFENVPSFLINPNAPSIQTNHHHHHASSVLQSLNLNNVNHNPLSLIPSSSAPSLSALSAVSGAISGGGGGAASGHPGKEEPTCVRDLIYKAIEMSLQPESKGVPGAPLPPSVTPDPPTSTAIAMNAAIHHRGPTSNSVADQAAVQAAYQAINLKRSNTPNDSMQQRMEQFSVMEAAKKQALGMTGKPEGLYAAYYGAPPGTINEDEVQDLSKKPLSMPDRKPTPSQIEALVQRPSSRGSPYKADKLSVSSSPGLRASPSLKGPPQSLTPTLFQQQFGGAGMPPQPAHSNPSISPALRLDPSIGYQLDPKAMAKGVVFPPGMMPMMPQPQGTPPLDRNKLHKQQLPPGMHSSALMPKLDPNMPLHLQTPPPGIPGGAKTPNSYLQLSPKSSNFTAAAAQAYRDKLLPQSAGGGSITQGTPVVMGGQQQSGMPSTGKFVPPGMGSAQHINSQASYEAILRRINATSGGSITAGTPLSVSQAMAIPGLMPVPSSVCGPRKDGFDMKTPPGVSILPRTGNLNFDSSVMFDPFYKQRNSSPNSAANTNAAAYHRPFSPNFQSPYGIPPPPGLAGKPLQAVLSSSSSSSSKEQQLANQILIDFNTSKQMQPRRSSASSEKEHGLANSQAGAVVDPLRGHRGPSPGQFPPPPPPHLGPSPSPNSAMYLRPEELAKGISPLAGLPAPPPGVDPILHWQQLASMGYLSNRQNVIQQWAGVPQQQQQPPTPSSTPPVSSATKQASVIQAPKSSSPHRGEQLHLHLQNVAADLKRNSVSPLVTGGASASAYYQAGLPIDPLDVLVNTAIQQKSLTIPPTTMAGVRLKDTMPKPPSAEGFEKCLIDNINQQQSQHGAYKQSARIVYPPSQEDLINDLSKSKTIAEEIKARMKVEPLEAGSEMRRFSPGPAGFPPGLIQPPPGGLHPMTTMEAILEQRKKMDRLAAAASTGVNPNGPNAGSEARFRSVEALANSANHPNSHSPSLKFAREPFSSEVFERTLRQADQHREQEAADLKVRPNSINPMKPSAEQMDEASKIFSQSFQKDSHHQEQRSNSGGHLTAANLIDAIITRQINTDSTSSTRQGSAPPPPPPSSVTPPGPAASPAGSVSSAPGGLSNFAANRFRSGLEGGAPTPPNSAPTPPAVPTQVQVQQPIRPSSTSAVAGFAALQHLSAGKGSTPSDTREASKVQELSKMILPPTPPTASVSSVGDLTASTGPAGSLRETIFNVISNNFGSSPSIINSPQAGSIVSSAVFDPKSFTGVLSGMAGGQQRALMEGTAASMGQQTPTTSSSLPDKLRIALQPGEKHPMAREGSEDLFPQLKRQAIEGDVLRQQIITQLNATSVKMTAHTAMTTTSGHFMEPISPPTATETASMNSSNSTMVTSSSAANTATVTATHWPPIQQQPISAAAQVAASTPSTTSAAVASSGQWTSMPTFSFFGDKGLRVNLPNDPNQVTSTNSGSTANAANVFITNKITDAMLRGNAGDDDSKSRSGTSKSSLGDSQGKADTNNSHLTINSKLSSYPVRSPSPSSPPEMVIDENRAPSLSPDIKTNESTAHPLHAFEVKKPEPAGGDSRSSPPGLAGVIKKHAMNDHDGKATNSKDAPMSNSAASLSGPIFEPLSDDEDAPGGNAS